MTATTTPTFADFLKGLTEASHRMAAAFRGLSIQANPERAALRRAHLSAQVHLDRAVRDARETLSPAALREDLADLSMETRLYVSGRLDAAYTEDLIVSDASWFIRQGEPRCAQALLEGWLER